MLLWRRTPKVMSSIGFHPDLFRASIGHQCRRAHIAYLREPGACEAITLNLPSFARVWVMKGNETKVLFMELRAQELPLAIAA